MSAQLQGGDAALVLLVPAAMAGVHVRIQISRGNVLSTEPLLALNIYTEAVMKTITGICMLMCSFTTTKTTKLAKLGSVSWDVF